MKVYESGPGSVVLQVSVCWASKMLGLYCEDSPVGSLRFSRSRMFHVCAAVNSWPSLELKGCKYQMTTSGNQPRVYVNHN